MGAKNNSVEQKKAAQKKSKRPQAVMQKALYALFSQKIETV